jgi:GT2 family glycosyltransferase
MKDPGPAVDVVIVNWNAGEQLHECIASLAAACHRECRLGAITVVDNASTDESADVSFPELPLRILRNGTNRGFAAACNQGARGTSGEYILFLNPDTTLQSRSLDVAVATLQTPAHRRAAVAGIQLYDQHGDIARSCQRFPTCGHLLIKALGLDRKGWLRSYWMTDWPHDHTRIVDNVIGAFYLVRRGVFEALSGFDERFFMYFEDLDFSLRARQAGWHAVYVADARAFHKGGGTSQRVPARRLAYSVRSRLQYADKHFRMPGRVSVRVASLGIEPVIRLAHAALRHSSREVSAVLDAYRLLLDGQDS